MIEEILSHGNIYLFSFNDCPEITADLNNYKDTVHYGTWINSLILKWMRDGEHQLTEENYLDYLQRERDFYTSFDYSTMNTQEDYEYSFYAAALLNEEVTGSSLSICSAPEPICPDAWFRITAGTAAAEASYVRVACSVNPKPLTSLTILLIQDT